MPALFGKSQPELAELLTALGVKPYRARQLWDALYRQRITTLDSITTFPAALRATLAAEHALGIPEITQTATSIDGTERYLMRMADGETVETVWMPDGDLPGDEDEEPTPKRAGQNPGAPPSREALRWVSAPCGPQSVKSMDRRNQGALATLGYRRATICISSQVGCAVNCQFCLTAKLGIRRDLTAGEIAGQVAAVLNRHRVQIGRDRINLVFMGMGEPFLNYDNFMAAVRLLVEGIGIPASRMTVSTSGIEPAIRRFAAEPVRPNLALSLNASNDTVREAVMPVTRKWKIAQLLDAVRTVPMTKRDWVTFEYVLLGGVNDQPLHAREVLALLKPGTKTGAPPSREAFRWVQTPQVPHAVTSPAEDHGPRTTDHGPQTEALHAKINLIVWNPGPGIPYTQPTPEAVETFQRILIDGGIPTYIRRPRGLDIYAACGQLKRTIEPELVTLSA